MLLLEHPSSTSKQEENLPSFGIFPHDHSNIHIQDPLSQGPELLQCQQYMNSTLFFSAPQDYQKAIKSKWICSNLFLISQNSISYVHWLEKTWTRKKKNFLGRWECKHGQRAEEKIPNRENKCILKDEGTEAPIYHANCTYMPGMSHLYWYLTLTTSLGMGVMSIVRVIKLKLRELKLSAQIHTTSKQKS